MSREQNVRDAMKTKQPIRKSKPATMRVVEYDVVASMADDMTGQRDIETKCVRFYLDNNNYFEIVPAAHGTGRISVRFSDGRIAVVPDCANVVEIGKAQP